MVVLTSAIPAAAHGFGGVVALLKRVRFRGENSDAATIEANNTPASGSGSRHAEYLRKLRFGVKMENVLWQGGLGARVAECHTQAQEKVAAGEVVTQHDENAVAPPIWQQGCSALNTKEAIEERLKLRRHPQILEVLQMFWETALRSERSNHGHADAVELSRDGYGIMMRRVYKVLIEDYYRHDIDADIEKDWHTDAKEQAETGLLGRERFCDAVFELTDTWTTTMDGSEYSAFLRHLFAQITELTDDGTGGLAAYIWKGVDDCSFVDYGGNDGDGEDSPRRSQRRRARKRRSSVVHIQKNARRRLSIMEAKKREKAVVTIQKASRQKSYSRLKLGTGGPNGAFFYRGQSFYSKDGNTNAWKVGLANEWHTTRPDTEGARKPTEAYRGGGMRAGVAHKGWDMMPYDSSPTRKRPQQPPKPGPRPSFTPAQRTRPEDTITARVPWSWWSGEGAHSASTLPAATSRVNSPLVSRGSASDLLSPSVLRTADPSILGLTCIRAAPTSARPLSHVRRSLQPASLRGSHSITRLTTPHRLLRPSASQPRLLPRGALWLPSRGKDGDWEQSSLPIRRRDFFTDEDLESMLSLKPRLAAGDAGRRSPSPTPSLTSKDTSPFHAHSSSSLPMIHSM